MSEFFDTLCEAVAALGAEDPRRARFGAAGHGYELREPLGAGELRAVEQRLGVQLPDDLRAFATEVARGGAGPGYGWIDLDRVALIDGAVPLAHLGCGYAAVLARDGEVWIDARAVGSFARAQPTFTAWYLDWIQQLARGGWPPPILDAGACHVAAALSDHLSRGGALDDIEPGALQIRCAEPLPLFDPGDLLDPCIACARTLEGARLHGLPADALAPGAPPKPLRGRHTAVRRVH